MIVRTANDSILNSLLDGVMALVTVALMVQYSLLLATVTVCGAMLYALLRCCFGESLQMRTQEQIVAQTAESAHFLESLRCIRTVKVLAREQMRHQEWLTAAVDAANAKAIVGKLQVLFKAAGSAIGVVEQVSVFWLAMGAVIRHDMTVGAVVAFLAFREQFYQRVSSVVETLVDVKLLRVHADRVSDIVMARQDRGGQGGRDQGGRDQGGREQQRLGFLGGSISCTNVSFRYSQSSAYVLDNINLHVDEGEHIAITGTSGCGKSTLIALLLGLQQPVEGHVKISGVPLGALGRDELRQHVVAVSQDDVLFSGSIMQNIAAFDAEIDVEFAMSCARLVQIDEDILRMPMGYNTLVGESGDGLSGGQKQRICLARALYRRPRVLVMDEATSNLDVPTERLIAAAIKELGMTRITIAHRPETIRSAEKLYILHQGVLSEANSVELLPGEVAVQDSALRAHAEA